MNARELINFANTHDIRLTPKGGRLLVDAPKGLLTPGLTDSLKVHKSKILERLEKKEKLAKSTTEKSAEIIMFPGVKRRCDYHKLYESKYREKSAPTSPDTANNTINDDGQHLT